MIEPIGEASPRLKARIAGVFYLLEMLTGGFAILFVGVPRIFTRILKLHVLNTGVP
jgi:hypothetical protein